MHLLVANVETVISLMYEAWEFRDTDVDLNYCKKNRIKIAGVWENHPDVYSHVS